MPFKSLHIKGFRNLQATDLDFSQKEAPVFVFVGPNGQGKTNLLEAIYLLAFTKSFRANENNDLIGFNEDFCSIKGSLDAEGRIEDLEIVITKNPPEKGLKVNGVFHKVTDFIGHLSVVFFSPDDLLIVQGPPGLRRRTLDLLLIQLDPACLSELMRYQYLIRQRNALLRQIRDSGRPPSDLEVWDEELALVGSSIVQKRLNAIDRLLPLLNDFYSRLSQKEAPIQIDYHSSGGEPLDSKAAYLDALKKALPRDVQERSTTIGPHRDDIVFREGGRSLGDFGSRGEQRSVILALKLTEIALLKGMGMQPLLLLDDVFSELDEHRQKHLFDAISGVQTFVTTTHLDFLKAIVAPKKVYRVHEGTVSVG